MSVYLHQFFGDNIMKLIEKSSVDSAFENHDVCAVRVIRKSEKEWYFTFDAHDPLQDQNVTYAMLTQRGKLRTWADPRNLFDFLAERGVKHGEFLIEDKIEEE